MALARTLSVALIGTQAHVVDVEVDVGNGLPGFTLTALADRALSQAPHRLRSAITNSEQEWPNRKVTVGLSPASVPKSGSRFDLAIAAALLAASDCVPAASLCDLVVLGELGLDGSVKPVTGILPAVIGAYRCGLTRFVVPRANLAEAQNVAGADITGVRSLAEMCAWLRDEISIEPGVDEETGLPPEDENAPDLADVVGQDGARRVMEVAAAGGHHVYLEGPPGVGKTMLAERLPGLLPELTEAEALEVTGIHSVAGRLPPGRPLIRRPPFFAPHHTSTRASIIGGGSGIAMPGAVSLAHRGVLFLDEAPEFGARALDALRQPLESGSVTINRSGGIANYPSRFLLVLAANPCPCAAGGRDAGADICTCSSVQRRRYQARLSGPLIDRVDLRAVLEPVSRAILAAGAQGESTAAVRARVETARRRAQERLAATPWLTNAEVPGPVLRRRWPIPAAALRPIYTDMDRGRLTTRGVDRVLKVAWTFADLAGRDLPNSDDVICARAMRFGSPLRDLAVPA
jgi:magnesium chelatase family protein